jgi:sugar phosphate isomerase/epimerase
MEFGIVSIGWFYQWEIEDSTRHFAKMGWLNIDIGPEKLMETLDNGGHKRIKAYKDLCEHLGTRIWQCHCSFWDGEKEIDKRELKDIEKYMEYCRFLNVPFIGFHPSARKYRSLEEKQEIMRHNIDFFKKVSNLAEQIGVKVVIENLPEADRTGAKISELSEIIEAVGSDSIGICLDTSHAFIMNIDVVEAVYEYAHLIWATHTSGCDEAGGQHRIPFNASY